MRIRVLYFDGCPEHHPAVELVRQILSDLKVEAQVEETEVQNAEEAEKYRFLGSPTIQVNGVDIEPGAAGRSDYAMSCRMYGASGTPPRKLVEEAIRGGHS
jgi:hypothetical protein